MFAPPTAIYIHASALIIFLTEKFLKYLASSQFCNNQRSCNQIHTTGATTGAGTTYPSKAHEFTPGSQWGSCFSIFSFIRMFCRSLFVLLSFLFWPLFCLPFFFTDSDYPLVSSISSYSRNKPCAQIQISTFLLYL